MPDPWRRCFAQIAVRLTSIANRFARLADLAPRLGPFSAAAVAPFGSAHAEVGLERAGKGGGRRKAVAQRDLEHARVMQQAKRAGGALKPDTTDEIGQRFAGDGGEHAMEMERRERCNGGELLQR